MIGGVRPLLPEILDQNDRVGAKSEIEASLLNTNIDFFRS